MSAAAPVIAMLEVLEREALAELEHALSLRLEPGPTAAERRWAELGALAMLLNALPPEPEGRTPRLAREVYERHRMVHAPDAPDHRTLVVRYGSWAGACRAAHGLLPDGRYLGVGKPWASPSRGRAKTPAYSADELYEAIRRCALEIGRIPTSHDYHRWSLEKKHRARQTGAQLRIPDIKVLYRIYPNGENRWQLALVDARLNEVEVARARARKLLGVACRELPNEPMSRLRLLAESALTNAGFSLDDRGELERAGVGWLPLSRAAVLAELLGGSLDWLVERSLEPGSAPARNSVFASGTFSALLTANKVSPKQVREQLDLPSGPFRDLVGGKREPIVAELVVMATLLRCRLDDLVSG